MTGPRVGMSSIGRSTAPTCQTPDERQRDQVNCRSSSGFCSWLTASGEDSFCRDEAEKRAIGWRPAPGCVAVLAVPDHISAGAAQAPADRESPLVAVFLWRPSDGDPMIRRLAMRKVFSFMVSTTGWWLLPLERCGRAWNPRPS